MRAKPEERLGELMSSASVIRRNSGRSVRCSISWQWTRALRAMFLKYCRTLISYSERFLYSSSCLM